jgi:hypothetical protein
MPVLITEAFGHGREVMIPGVVVEAPPPLPADVVVEAPPPPPADVVEPHAARLSAAATVAHAAAIRIGVSCVGVSIRA